MNEATIKIVSRLDLIYGNLIDQQKVRQVVDEVLYEYDLTPKETLPAVLDNMGDRILLYLASRKIEGLSVNSVKQYGRILGRFSNALRRNVEDITTMDIRIYLANFSKTGVKNTTLATHTDSIRRFFKWLVDEEYIERNPLNKIKTPKVEKRIREALTEEEFEILRTGTKTLRQKALLELFYSTGCRLEEIEQMKKSDIDWQRLQIKVIGKGNKQRVVFINATSQVHLKKYLMSRFDDCEYVFATQRQPITNMDRSSIQREVKIIQKQSELSVNVYPHLLRHTAATHWLNSGMDITTVQSILGHDNLDTTQIYAQISNSTIEHEFRKYS